MKLGPIVANWPGRHTLLPHTPSLCRSPRSFYAVDSKLSGCLFTMQSAVSSSFMLLDLHPYQQLSVFECLTHACDVNTPSDHPPWKCRAPGRAQPGWWCGSMALHMPTPRTATPSPECPGCLPTSQISWSLLFISYAALTKVTTTITTGLPASAGYLLGKS